MESNDLIKYYDNYVAPQQEAGINDRIYSLYKRLKKLGLNSSSHVLELGCGIGTMTFLLSKTIRAGQVEAVDISPESIRFAAQRIKKTNIRFFAHDIVNYSPTLRNIHFITLFDVIEHIPAERHRELFLNLYNICSEDTKILINIPNPDYIQYDIENNPDALQIIDQPLPLHNILQNIDDNHLQLLHFETYSIWVENDYQFLLVTRKRNFVEKKISDKRNFFQKARKKIERTILKIKYPYR